MNNDVTVQSLATEVQISVDRLIQQFADAGILKTANDSVTMKEKQTLLAHLNREHGSVSNKLKLQRKTRSTLNISGSGGKSRLVKIEIRKTHTLVKRNPREENVAADGQEKCAMKLLKEFKAEHEAEEKIGNDNQQNDDRQNKAQFKIGKEDRTGYQQIDESTKITQVKKLCNEDKVTELNPQVETRYIAEEACHITEENGKNIEIVELTEAYANSFYVKTSQYIRQANEKNSRKVTNSRSYRNMKSDREESITIRNTRSSKRKSFTLQQEFQKPAQVINRDVVIGETITVGELANKMAVKSSQVIKAMMMLGAMATINQVIDQETAQLVAEEMGHKVILRRENELEEAVMSDRDVGDRAEVRAPVVTMMGHVDHGKTSLLDCIRSTKVTSCEAGGITQHIGAYHVETHNGMITFLDTPGHTAFTSMRARGAQITDIVVLVVAADDGVMPQTIEAIQHAKAACVPIVVAINKTDKLEADPDRVKTELSKHGILSEEWGGENQFVQVSAKTGIGVDELLDSILLQAEILELKAVRKCMASGVVIESFLDKGSGPVATVLVREGTLHKGDIVLCGLEHGRIRAMHDEFGRELLEAGPSIPVEILGLSGVPAVGDIVTVVRDDKKAREVALYRQGKFREVKLARQKKSNFGNVFDKFDHISDDKVHEINIVLKADVQGSVEAISDSLLKLSNHEVKIRIIGSGVGGITESDSILAAASNAILIGFNVRADASARRIIETENLDLRYYSVIYHLIDEIKTAMSGILSPEIKQRIIGLAEVRNVFNLPKFGSIAGCMVIEGVIKRHHPIHVLRENSVIYKGQLESLRRFKEDVNEVRNNMECGIGVKNYNDVRVGDIIEVLETIQIQRSIN